MFRDVDGQDRVAFQRDAEGRMIMLSEYPFFVFQRVSISENRIVNLFVIGFSLGVLLLTVLLWPVTALVLWPEKPDRPSSAAMVHRGSGFLDLCADWCSGARHHRHELRQARCFERESGSRLPSDAVICIDRCCRNAGRYLLCYSHLETARMVVDQTA
jgi:hypothetical protein